MIKCCVSFYTTLFFKYYTMKNSNIKAMIFAAGIGSRLKPITDFKPKALVEFNGRPLLEYAILKLKYYGVKQIIINVHHFADQIIKYVETHDFGIEISISDESSKLLNTGGGLINVKDFFDSSEPFIVYNVDIISDINLQDFYDFHINHNAMVSLAVCERLTQRYLLFDNFQLCGWENRDSDERKIIHKRNSYNPFAFSGIQFINPTLFNYVTLKGAFSIMDLYLELAREHKIIAYNHTNDFWLDVGKFSQLQEVEEKLAKHSLEYLT